MPSHNSHVTLLLLCNVSSSGQLLFDALSICYVLFKKLPCPYIYARGSGHTNQAEKRAANSAFAYDSRVKTVEFSYLNPFS